MAVAPMFLPFREALLAGLRRGQRLRCPLSSLQRVRADAQPSSGGWPLYRYCNRMSGETVESARVEALVERWMTDLELATQMGLEMRRRLDAAIEREAEGGGDGE